VLIRFIIDYNVPDNNKYYRDLDKPFKSCFERKCFESNLSFFRQPPRPQRLKARCPCYKTFFFAIDFAVE
jgi:hypothetical protein